MERNELDRISHVVQFQDIHFMLKGKYTDLIVVDRAVFDRKDIVGMEDRFQDIGVRHFDAVICLACNMIGKDADFF